MLYLDSSALVKVYFKEIGTATVIARASDPHQEVCTSVLTFAEVQSAFARRHRERLITSRELAKGRELFERDWSSLLNVIDLNMQSMAALPKLVERFPLRASDAVHLSTAIWLNANVQSNRSSDDQESVEFGVADKALAEVAGKCGLRIFNPED